MGIIYYSVVFFFIFEISVFCKEIKSIGLKYYIFLDFATL